MCDAVEDFGTGQTAISSSVATKITDGPGIGKSLKGLQIVSLSTNTGIIYVGGVNVTAANGFPLYPGQGLLVPAHTVGKIYGLAAVNAEKLAFIWM